MKLTLKRTLAFLLAAVMCLSMVACGGSDDKAADKPAADDGASNVAADNGGAAEDKYIKVRMQYPNDPGDYRPFGADNSVRTALQLYFYEFLFSVLDDGLTPIIASGYESLGDGVYEITINEGVHDYKGNPITADDVVFCYQTTVDKGERTTTVGELKKIEKIDDLTIRITLDPDIVGCFERIVGGIPVLSKKSYEESETGFSSDPIGTGPYYVEEWLQGSYMILKKDENYWAKDKGYNNQNCDEIEIKFISEPTQVAIEMESGGIDFAYGVSEQDVDTFRELDGFQVVSVPDHLTCCLGYNFDSPAVSDLRVRQAISYAIDPTAMVQGALMGKGGVCYAPIINDPFYIDYVDSWDEKLPFEYDVEKAKALLAEAGYADGLKLSIMCKDLPIMRSICEITQAYLAEVGIELEILAYENALYQTYRYQSDMFDICLVQIGNATNYSANGWRWYLTENAEGKNIFFQKDPHMTELLLASLSPETNSEESVDALWQYMMETCCTYPLIYGYKNFVATDMIAEPYFTALGSTFRADMSTYN